MSSGTCEQRWIISRGNLCSSTAAHRTGGQLSRFSLPDPREDWAQLFKPGIGDPKILEALNSVQPYRESDYDRDPSESVLWTISELCNIDKHRLLLTMVHSLDIHNPGWWGLPEEAENPAAKYRVAPLGPGDEVASFQFREILPLDFDPHITLAVGLAEIDTRHWTRGENVIGLLQGAGSYMMRTQLAIPAVLP